MPAYLIKIKKTATAALAICLGGFAFIYAPCLIKTISGYPCPACGTRRAFLALLQGNIIESLLINPYGILFTLLACGLIAGLLYDYITNRSGFRLLCRKAEARLANKYMLCLCASLMLLNWIWNIYKGL